MYILTGGAGFIGSVVLNKLNQEGIKDVIVVDNLNTSSKWKNLLGKDYIDYYHKDEFFQFLQEDEFPCFDEPNNIDAIIHLGACSTTTVEDMDYLIKNNFHYTMNLANFAMDYGIRFIYASSAATYGGGENGYSDDIKNIPLLRPLNRYGYSKHLFDSWALKNDAFENIVGLKFFNVYGPNEYHKDGQFSGIYRSFLQVKETAGIKLFKSGNPDYQDGEQKRDFVYVKDIADVILWLLKNKKVNGIYNVGSGKARTWKDLAKAVFKSLDLPENIEYIDMPENLRKQYQYFTEADISKLRKAGYKKPMTKLEDGIRDYVVNYLKDDLKYI